MPIFRRPPRTCKIGWMQSPIEDEDVHMHRCELGTTYRILRLQLSWKMTTCISIPGALGLWWSKKANLFVRAILHHSVHKQENNWRLRGIHIIGAYTDTNHSPKNFPTVLLAVWISPKKPICTYRLRYLTHLNLCDMWHQVPYHSTIASFDGILPAADRRDLDLLLAPTPIWLS
jgi:hypothetical protein